MRKNRRDFIKILGLSHGSNWALQQFDNTISSDLSNVRTSKNKLKKDQSDDKSVRLTFLQTTDVHCQVHPHDELYWENGKTVFKKSGGYANLGTYINNFKRKNPDTFVVDTGDMFQGSQLSVLTEGKAMVPIINSIDYDAFVPGNWEVIYYKKNMLHLMGNLNAPKICTNMFHQNKEGGKGELIFPPYHIWYKKGIKIGFLAYTDHMVPLRQSPNYSSGIIYTKPEENIAYYIDVLKNQEQCNFIIVLAHMGLSQQIHLANQEVCKGVDYIFGGDTHERIRVPIQCKYAKVVEPGAFGSFVGKLTLNFKNGKLASEDYELVDVHAEKIVPDKKIKTLIENIEKPFKSAMDEIWGYSTIPLYRYFVIENPIDTLVLNALKHNIPEVDIVLSNGFRFCPPKAQRDQTGNIPITQSYVFDMLPVDSVVRKATVTGKQIKDWMEKELNNVFAANAAERFGGWVVKFEGMKVTFKAFGENGKRVESISISGNPLDLQKTYSVCACERDGDPEDMLCRIKGVKNMVNTPLTLHTVMKNYLKAHKTVTPTPSQNAIATDAPATLLTQVTGVDYQFK